MWWAEWTNFRPHTSKDVEDIAPAKEIDGFTFTYLKKSQREAKPPPLPSTFLDKLYRDFPTFFLAYCHKECIL
jgi:hypothetical protein